MTEDWKTTDDVKKGIITAVFHDVNNQIEEMVEDLECPRTFAEALLKSIADNFKDGTKSVKDDSSYSSRHTSTPEYERDAREIVSKHERRTRNESSTSFKSLKDKINFPENDDKQNSLYSSRHMSTQEDEKEAEAIVTKNESVIREAMKKENSQINEQR